jgi:hypothetical protein
MPSPEIVRAVLARVPTMPVVIEVRLRKGQMYPFGIEDFFQFLTHAPTFFHLVFGRADEPPPPESLPEVDEKGTMKVYFGGYDIDVHTFAVLVNVLLERCKPSFANVDALVIVATKVGAYYAIEQEVKECRAKFAHIVASNPTGFFKSVVSEDDDDMPSLVDDESDVVIDCVD